MLCWPRRGLRGVLVYGVAMGFGLAVPGSASAITGGSEFPVERFSSVVYLADSSGGTFCGGVLVAPAKVLTAAHCTEDVPQREVRVVAGRQHQRDSDGVQASVSSVWKHPDYRGYGTGSDMAVLTLGQRIPFPAAAVAQDQHRDLYAPGTEATVFGWGRLALHGERSDTLRSVTVPVTTDQACSAAYSGYDPRTMVCAGYQEGGKDSCEGDSGGPLVVGHTVIGVVSFGSDSGCGAPGKPGVYTRISTFAADLAKQIR